MIREGELQWQHIYQIPSQEINFPRESYLDMGQMQVDNQMQNFGTKLNQFIADRLFTATFPKILQHSFMGYIFSRNEFFL